MMTDPIVQPRRRVLGPVRFIDTRKLKRTSDGRLWWHETWSNGTVTKRFMGPKERAAYLRGRDA
jgi:hypothetical protein